MAKLFSYCLRIDAGSAPNPFWGICTLAICKPRIRQAAEIGDWVVGTGSEESGINGFRTSVVYAMQVTDKMTMAQYDKYCRRRLKKKIPKWKSRDPRRQLGDCIYDFSHDPPVIRDSVHTESERDRDLSGRFVLLSNRFYYFGDRPVRLPKRLHGIVKKGPGHRSTANDRHLKPFVLWLEDLGVEPNVLHGGPQRQFSDSPVEIKDSDRPPRGVCD